MPIQIAIAEDNSFALKALQDRLSNHPEVRIRHIARNGKELMEQLKQNNHVDLILMDLQMPEMNGIEATAEVKKLFPQIKVLILTMYDDDEYLFKAIMAGASGYLLKEDDSTQVFQSIMNTMSGGAAMSPAIALQTLNLVRNPFQSGYNKEAFELTARELELLEQLKNGLTYEKIGSNLNISYHTVRKHIENIYRKLQVNNKVEALKKASENRLI
jgi:DNA-binding NarL/FixJ family response regulator